MGPRLTLTFKESEVWLYDEIMRHSGKGNWIKDILIDYIKAENEIKSDQKQQMKDDFSILGDFNC